MNKKYYIGILVAALLFCSCGIERIPLKGNYDFPPYVTESEKSFDDVWATLIDTLAVMGYGIKTIDKESGIVVIEDMSFSNTFSREDENGKLVNDKKYIAISRIKVYGRQIKPDKITAEWNVRVKPNKTSGRTMINVNLKWIEAKLFGSNGEIYSFDSKSTGKFEEYIASLIR